MRKSHCDAAFDYWGKGTTVTVTSGPKSPDLITMSQCNPSSTSILIGCLASGFSPNSLDFTWKDQNGASLTNVSQYPTVGTGQNTYKFSLLNVAEDEFDKKTITCEAAHQEKTFRKDFKKADPQEPTLSLFNVTTEKSTFVVCVMEDFYPKNLTVQWKVNGINQQSQSKPEYRKAGGLFTAQSFYKVNSETSSVNTEYTCEVTHNGRQLKETKNLKAKFTLTLKPPNVKEIFVNNRVVFEAVVSGDIQKTVESASVSCKINNVEISLVQPNKAEFSKDHSQFIKRHSVTVDSVKWFNGDMVTCTTKDTNNNKIITQEIHFSIGDGKIPNVNIYKPDNISADPVSHVCEVTSTQLGDVYIMWTVGNKPYMEGLTSTPIHREGSFSVLSIITVTKKEYDSPETVITCAVKHAKMKDTKSPLQKSTGKTEPPEPETGFALDCNEHVLEEDEFKSLWSTATSFIFLFLFSLTYSAVLSLFKVKQ